MHELSNLFAASLLSLFHCFIMFCSSMFLLPLFSFLSSSCLLKFMHALVFHLGCFATGWDAMFMLAGICLLQQQALPAIWKHLVTPFSVWLSLSRIWSFLCLGQICVTFSVCSSENLELCLL